jgi:hypothetical protein
MPRASGIKITKDLQDLYERERRLDIDPDAPTLSPQMWEKAVVGKFH